MLPLAGLGCSSSSTPDDDGQSGTIEDEDYPNLARVPGEQPRPTPSSLRDELIAGLAADRANARYSDEALTGTSAAAPPAAPPPAARTQVEIIWDTLRVEPEGAGAAAAAAGAAELQEGVEEEIDEEVEVNWETETAEPSDQIAMVGAAEAEEEVILAPGPELVGVVYFDGDSAQVDAGDQALLEEVVALYKERGGRLRLVGHASPAAGGEDAVGQRMADLDLSLQRAQAVATSLLDLGAEKDNMMIEAKTDGQAAGAALGSDAAVTDGSGGSGEGGDRRVEIFLDP